MNRAGTIPADQQESDRTQELLDTYRATLNILDDFNEEKIKMEDMQRAVVNILEDFDSERSNVEITNRILVKEIGARQKTEADLRRKTEQLVRSNEDVEKFAQRDREISAARDALSEQVQATSKANSDLEATLAQLQETQAQLVQQEKLAGLGSMVAGVAHEINTPVGVGVTAASTLQDATTAMLRKCADEELTLEGLQSYGEMVTQSTEMILLNLSRAADLIQSFKQVAVDQSSGERRQFELKSYLHEILMTLQPKLKSTSHEIGIGCPEGILVDGYPGAIAQILTNFVMNSLVHGFSGRKNGRIVISFNCESDRVFLSYQDNGVGISQEHLKKVFDPFFTTNRGGGGSGLGLHIVYNLVTRLLGGTIRVASEHGKGVNFEVTFPVAG